MDGSVSTSVSSVRTVYQSHSQHLAESAEGSQSRRDNVPGAAAHSSGEGSSNSYGSVVDYTENSTMSSHYSGVMVSTPSSPRMHALVLPSPPNSPGGSPSSSVDNASESSLPSVSSSFFFSSSAAGSPGRSHPSSYPSSHPQSDHEHDHDHDPDHDHQGRHHRRVHEQGLIIPSLSLPDALRRPTPFGQTLGDIRILVLGAQGAGKSFLTGLLLEDNEDVVDVGTWEDWNGAEAGIDVYGKVLRASTDWLEQQNVFGLERFEPTKNVEIIELPGYSHDTDSTELISRLKSIIEAPFRSLHDVLHPETDPSGVVASLLAAPTSPLYTALLFLLPSSPTPLDSEFIHALSTYIPLIVLPRLSGTHRVAESSTRPPHIPSAKVSAFRPASPVALRNGLFRSPETAALLRAEAVDRFLRWREVEKAVEGIWESSLSTNVGSGRGTLRAGSGRRGATFRRTPRKLSERDWGRGSLNEKEGDIHRSQQTASERSDGWSKAKWEAEWMEDYAQEVARRVREDATRKHVIGRSRAGTVLPPSKNLDTDASSTTAADNSGGSVDSGLAHCVDGPHTHGMHPSFDPLHLPSLIVFSVSLIGPLRVRVWASLQSAVESLNETKVQVALFGGFCIGVGAGFWARAA